MLTDSIRSQRVFAEKNLITFGIYLMRRIFESVCERTTTVKTRVLYTHTHTHNRVLAHLSLRRERVCVWYIYFVRKLVFTDNCKRHTTARRKNAGSKDPFAARLMCLPYKWTHAVSCRDTEIRLYFIIPLTKGFYCLRI